jgi:hypothetical protein
MVLRLNWIRALGHIESFGQIVVDKFRAQYSLNPTVYARVRQHGLS